jgi:hypothetical protein
MDIFDNKYTFSYDFSGSLRYVGLFTPKRKLFGKNFVFKPNKKQNFRNGDYLIATEAGQFIYNQQTLNVESKDMVVYYRGEFKVVNDVKEGTVWLQNIEGECSLIITPTEVNK